MSRFLTSQFPDNGSECSTRNHAGIQNPLYRPRTKLSILKWPYPGTSEIVLDYLQVAVILLKWTLWYRTSAQTNIINSCFELTVWRLGSDVKKIRLNKETSKWGKWLKKENDWGNRWVAWSQSKQKACLLCFILSKPKIVFLFWPMWWKQTNIEQFDFN